MDTNQKVEDLLVELDTIAQNTPDSSFFGFFETDKGYIVKTHGSVIDFAKILICVAEKDEDLKTSILMAALMISKKDNV